MARKLKEPVPEPVDIDRKVAEAIEQRLNPPIYPCLRLTCEGGSVLEAALCSRCSETGWSVDEARGANVASRMGFPPGTLFNDVEAVFGMDLDALERLDRQGLCDAWDLAGQAREGRPLSPAEQRHSEYVNAEHLRTQARERLSRQVQSREAALLKAQAALVEARSLLSSSKKDR